MEAPAAMDAEDDDARGFKAVFTAAGEELLQGRMREKLREFRRSESDPEGLLLDYVMVLLKNERCKNKTIEDLHVFLGNDSDAFVSWLWEHLSSHLHLYAQSQEQNQETKNDESPKEISGRQK